MSMRNPALWARLAAFDLDDGNAALSFTTRLARENAWSLEFAGRVLSEYKRFVYLACVAGHSVTPSDQVDQAWHLHLTYTHSYWDDLCEGILHRPLHHGPTRGGQREQHKYRDLYAQTIASYQTEFGTTPPDDIWPPSEERFRQSQAAVRVDRGRYWILPRLSTRAIVSTAGASASILPVLGLLEFFLQLPPDQFLAILGTCLIMAILFAFYLHHSFKAQISSKDIGHAQQLAGTLSSGEAALLMGGAARAVQASIAELRARKLIAIEDNRFHTTDESATKLDEQLSRHLYERITESPARWRDLMQSARIGVANLSSSLESKELIQPHPRVLLRKSLQALPFLMLLVAAVIRLVNGVSHDRPVGILVIFLIFGGMGLFVTVVVRAVNTRLGSDVAAALRARQKSEKLATPSFSPEDDAERAAMWTAVLGASALAASGGVQDANFFRSLARQETGAGYSSGGGDGGCSGGCSGCGGCGG